MTPKTLSGDCSLFLMGEADSSSIKGRIDINFIERKANFASSEGSLRDAWNLPWEFMQTLTIDVEVHDPYRINGRTSLTGISRGPLSEDLLPSVVDLIFEGFEDDAFGLTSYVPSVRARFFDVTLPLFVGDDVEFGFGSFLFSRDAHEGLPSEFDGCAVQFAEQDALVGFQTNVSPPSRDVFESIDDIDQERTFRAQIPAAQSFFVDRDASTRIEIRRSIQMAGMSFEEPIPSFRTVREIMVKFAAPVAMGEALAVVNALRYLAGLLVRYRISVTSLSLAWNESRAVMGGATFTSNANELPHGHDGILFDAIPHSGRLFQAIDEAPLAFQRLNRCLPRQNSRTSTALIGLCGSVEAMIKVFGLSGCVPVKTSGRDPYLSEKLRYVVDEVKDYILDLDLGGLLSDDKNVDIWIERVKNTRNDLTHDYKESDGHLIGKALVQTEYLLMTIVCVFVLKASGFPQDIIDRSLLRPEATLR